MIHSHPTLRRKPDKDFAWHPLFQVVDAFLKQVDGQDWTGSPTTLHTLLNAAAPEGFRSPNLWPATPGAMSSQLMRMSASLSRHGIVVSRSHSNAHRIIRVARVLGTAA